jgi:predicted dehydrogenase
MINRVMDARELAIGLVGGGPGSFIGAVHAMAAQLDSSFRLVCGAFSRDADRSRAAGARYGVPAERCYRSIDDLLAAERAGEAGGPSAVIIATPNESHAEIARSALNAGLHVFCDKPLTRTRAEAESLRALVARTNLVFRVAYAYSGYPLVREARLWCRAGRLGTIRKIVVEYSQGWLATAVEQGESVQAAWRVDPARAGAGGCVADIGVHGLHLAEFITGHRVVKLAADLSSVVQGRRLDDDCNVLLRFDNGAPGVLIASQIAVGERNGLRIRVYGERGGLEWAQETPDRLELRWLDSADMTLRRGRGEPALSASTQQACRLPAGHPEGFVEALGNLYREFADAIARHRAGSTQSPLDSGDAPGIDDGLRGMMFIDAAVQSSADGGRWVAL